MNAASLSLAALNAMTPIDFTAALGDIYEESPWVARAAAALRPFADRAALASAMAEAMRAADPARQLALLRAHPELGQRRGLTPHSATEQHERGLDRLDDGAAQRLAALNAAYRERFGFPFIVAVRGQRDMAAILHALQQRLAATPEQERRIALAEVEKIAGFRLEHRIGADA